MRAEGSEEEGLVGVAAEGMACTSEDGYVDTGPSGGIRPCMRRRVVGIRRGADHDSILNGASESRREVCSSRRRGQPHLCDWSSVASVALVICGVARLSSAPTV